jgi:hypothetical protein
MPNFTVKAPDGTTYDVTAPEGATQADVLARVKAQHSASGSTAKAGQLFVDPMSGAALDRPIGPGFGRSAAYGAAGGAAESFAGISQAALGAIGEVTGWQWAKDEATKGIPSRVAGIQSDVGKETAADPIAGEMGGMAGSIAPYAAIPGGPIVQGMVAGATRVMKGGLSDQLLERMLEGTVGGLAGLGLKLGGRAIVDLTNSAAIEKTLKEWMSRFHEIDPMISGDRKYINDEIKRLTQYHQDIGKEPLQMGDALGTVDTTKMGPQVRDIARSTASVPGADAKGAKLLTDTARVLNQDKAMPKSLKVGGYDYDYQPLTGEYLQRGSQVPLDEKIAAEATKAYSAGPPDVRYSLLRGLQDNMAGYLRRMEKSGNSAVQGVRDAKKIVDAKVDELQSPEMARRERQVQAFYDRYLKNYDKPEVKAILEETDDLKRANRVLDVAAGDDVDASREVAKFIGKDASGRVANGMMAKALRESIGKDGRIDGAKVAKFFEDAKAFEPFKSSQTDEMIGGFAKLLRQDAVKAGESRSPTLSRGVSQAATVAAGASALGSLVFGHPGVAAHTLYTYMGVEGAYTLWNKLARDTFGRHLLVAANRVSEASPRWQRLSSQIMQRFGGTATGMGAQAAGAGLQ